MERASDKLTPPSKQTSWQLGMLIILIGSFMAILDSSIVNVAISAMMKAFQSTTSRIQWVVTIYLLGLGVVVPLSGWLGDYLGLKKLYIYALSFFTFGSALCSLAWSEDILIAARVVQAIGGGVIMPTTMAMVYGMVPKEKIGLAMGMFGMTMVVAPSIGPSLGGYLVQYLNWRWIFTINLPLGMIGIFLAVTFLQDFPKGKAGKFDLPGSLTSSAALFCLLLALSQGQAWGWRSLPTVMLLFASFGLMVIFVYHELTTPDPLLNLRVFKYPAFTFGNILLMIINVGLYGGVFYIPLFLQAIRGLGALKVGLLMLPPALISGVTLPIAGKMYDKYGPLLPAAVGVSLLAFGTYLLTGITLDTPIRTIIVWMSIRSLGIGMTMMPVQTAILSVLPAEQVARGSSITNIITRISGSFGLAALTIALNSKLAYYNSYLSWTVTQENLSNIATITAGNKEAILGMLQGLIAKTAFVRSIEDLFYLITLFTLLAFIPTIFLRKKNQNNKPSGTIME